MGADRFYCPGMRAGPACRLEGDEARHLARVRRVAVGAEVEIFDGQGGAAVAEVVALGRDWVDLRIKQHLESVLVAGPSVILAVAIPKGDRFDWLIEKATELGVERVVPLLTARSTVDPRAAKLDRLRRAVVESCKQCRRDTLMTIDEPTVWDRWAALPVAPGTRRWLAHPGGSTTWNDERFGPGGTVIVAIGPEGGFAAQEVDKARDLGWEAIHLTPFILRIETAALAVAAHLALRTSVRQGG